MSRVLQVFFDVDLRNSHEGLAAVAKEKRINVAKLQPGEFVVFINSENNKLKMLGAFDVMGYIRLPRGHIELRTIELIPKAFNIKGRFEYQEALREVLIKKLAEKGHVVSDD